MSERSHPPSAIRATLIAIVALFVLVACTYLIARFGGTLGWVLCAVFVGALAASLDGVRTAVAAAAAGVSVVLALGIAPVATAMNSIVRLPAAAAANLGRAVVLPGGSSALGLLSILAAAAGAVALAIAGRSRKVQGALKPAWLSVVAVLAICGALWSGSAQPGVLVALRIPIATYSYDAGIYRSTYEHMETGTPYYEALVQAASRDSRIDAASVRDGKFVGWATSPSQVRLPFIFYLWTWLTASAVGVFALALALCFATILLVFLAFRPALRGYAVVAPVLLFPYLQSVLSRPDMFFPDFWAGMLVAIGVCLWLLKYRSWALLTMLMAGLCREVSLIAFVVFLIAALFAAKDNPTAWRRPLATAALALLVFGVVLAVHDRSAGGIIAASGGSVVTIRAMLVESARTSLASRFLAPIEFNGQWWWWELRVPAQLVFAGGVLGWFYAFRGHDREVAPALGLLGVWLLTLLTVGAHSSYWGLLFMPLVYIGCGAGAAVIMREGARLLAEPRSPALQD